VLKVNKNNLWGTAKVGGGSGTNYYVWEIKATKKSMRVLLKLAV
jgi:hypothetical protein